MTNSLPGRPAISSVPNYRGIKNEGTCIPLRQSFLFAPLRSPVSVLVAFALERDRREVSFGLILPPCDYILAYWREKVNTFLM